MFTSPPKRKPNKNQNRQTEDAQTASSSDTLNQTVLLDLISEDMASGGRPTESETIMEVDALSTDANTSVRTNTANIPLPVGRGRGYRTPTSPIGTISRISPVDNILGTVCSRLNAVDGRLTAIESIKEKVDVIMEKFNELLKIQNVNIAHVNSDRQNNDNETGAFLRTNFPSERGVNIGNSTSEYLGDTEPPE